MSGPFGCVDAAARLVAALLIRQFLQGLVDREAARLLSRREFLERRQVLPHDRLRRHQDEDVLDEPFDVIACLLLSPLSRRWLVPEQDELMILPAHKKSSTVNIIAQD
jgi:hypothetical protein